MESIIISILFLVACWTAINGAMGIFNDQKHDSYRSLGIFCFITAMMILALNFLNKGLTSVTYSLLAAVFIYSSIANILAEVLSKQDNIMCGYDLCRLQSIATKWRIAKRDGKDKTFLQNMNNSEYLRFISDALRIVHSVAVSLPRDYTFQVTDYGFLVDGISLLDNSRYKILVAYPSIKKKNIENLQFNVKEEQYSNVYVVSEDYGIKIDKLLDDMSAQVLDLD